MNLAIEKNSLFSSLEGKKVISGRGISKGETLSKEFLSDLPSSEWFKLRMQKDDLNDLIKEAKDNLKSYENTLKEKFEIKKRKILSGDDLAPGVQQTVKVYLAVKRKKLIESGVPEEDKEIRELDALIEVV